MIKSLLITTAAVMLLAGCVAVPVYSVPAPRIGFYGPPIATFSFGFFGHDSHRHGRGHRHGHRR